MRTPLVRYLGHCAGRTSGGRYQGGHCGRSVPGIACFNHPSTVHGAPALDEEGHLLLPRVFTSSGCMRVELHRRQRGHYLCCGPLAVDFASVSELVDRLCRSAPNAWRCAGVTLRSLTLGSGGAPRVRAGLGLAIGHARRNRLQPAADDPRGCHATLCALLSFLNPMVPLDDIIAFAVATGILLHRDNRTLTNDHLAICTVWHGRCWEETRGPVGFRRSLGLSSRWAPEGVGIG